MLTNIFYTSVGPAAKARSRAIAAVRGNYARVIDAGFWDGTFSACDAVEVMPDVPKWQRNRITEVYGDEIVRDAEDAEAETEVEIAQKPLGLMPEKQEQKIEKIEKKAVHKGGGRWFVMAGEDRLSGPHDKIEALKLAEA
jgi:hypothetical protein